MPHVAGELYLADIPPAQRHPVVVISHEELNRGDYVVAALITSQRFAVRSQLANCVPLKAGQFGMTQDCVVQGEMAGQSKGFDRPGRWPLDQLEDLTLRDVIWAIGYVMDADCEPSTLVTGSSWARRQPRSAPLSAYHTRTVLSQQPLTIRRPSGEKVSLVTERMHDPLIHLL